MKTINLHTEQIFIDAEVRTFISRNVPQLIRELLLCADVILLKYADTKSRKMKSFYKLIYMKTKKYYLERVYHQRTY